jgi:hypothetical protein
VNPLPLREITNGFARCNALAIRADERLLWCLVHNANVAGELRRGTFAVGRAHRDAAACREG